MGAHSHHSQDMSDAQLRILAGCALVASLLSLLAALAVILAYVLYYLGSCFSLWIPPPADENPVVNRKRQKLKRLVFGLISSQALLGLAKVVSSVFVLAGGDLKDGALCDVSGFLGETLSFTNAIYILSICLFMLLFVHQVKIRVVYEVVIHALAWGVPATVSILPLIPAVTSAWGWEYVPSGAWCFVGDSPKYLRFIILYNWVWVTFVVTAIIYAYLFLRVRRMRKKDISILLMLYPLAYIILWTPATINRALENFGPSIFAFAVLEALLLPLQGFVDCVLYTYTTLWPEARTARRRNHDSSIPTEHSSLQHVDFGHPLTSQDAKILFS